MLPNETWATIVKAVLAAGVISAPAAAVRIEGHQDMEAAQDSIVATRTKAIKDLYALTARVEALERAQNMKQRRRAAPEPEKKKAFWKFW